MRARTGLKGKQLDAKMWKAAQKFAVVGTLGFLADGGIMQLVVSAASVSPIAARAVSFPAAVTLTWCLNRLWTFESGRERVGHVQYLRYLSVQIVGFLINYLAFAGLVLQGGVWRDWPIAALAVGSVLAMAVTFLASHWFVFSPPRRV